MPTGDALPDVEQPPPSSLPDEFAGGGKADPAWHFKQSDSIVPHGPPTDASADASHE